MLTLPAKVFWYLPLDFWFRFLMLIAKGARPCSEAASPSEKNIVPEPNPLSKFVAAAVIGVTFEVWLVYNVTSCLFSLASR